MCGVCVCVCVACTYQGTHTYTHTHTHTHTHWAPSLTSSERFPLAIVAPNLFHNIASDALVLRAAWKQSTALSNSLVRLNRIPRPTWNTEDRGWIPAGTLQHCMNQHLVHLLWMAGSSVIPIPPPLPTHTGILYTQCLTHTLYTYNERLTYVHTYNTAISELLIPITHYTLHPPMRLKN